MTLCTVAVFSRNTRCRWWRGSSKPNSAAAARPSASSRCRKAGSVQARATIRAPFAGTHSSSARRVASATNSPAFRPWASSAASIAAARRSTGAVGGRMACLDNVACRTGRQYRNDGVAARIRRVRATDDANGAGAPTGPRPDRVRAVRHRPGAGRSATIAPMHTRPIPSSREPLPVIGCGTYLGFDQAPGSAGYAAAARRGEALFAAGGKVFDSSPMYGRAEETTGELLAANGRRSEAFVATKVWTQGRRGWHPADGGIDAAPAHAADRPDAGAQPGRLAHSTWRRCAAGRSRAGCATSASPTTRRRPTPRWSGCCRRRSSTSCRSTTRSTNASPSSGCCRSPPSAASP